MHANIFPGHPGQKRSGKALVLFTLVLPALIGLLGLVIDTGMLMSSYRQTQNAADAAAMACAMDMLWGKSDLTATATTFVQQHNGLPEATVTVSTPPAQGPHAGSNHHVEVTVVTATNTSFIHVLNGSRQTSVRARAVAGYESLSSGEGVVVLDPRALPGLTVGGGGTLSVNGRIVVNSPGAGWDEHNQWVDWGFNRYAITTGNNSRLQASNVNVVGGVDVPANILNLPGNTGSALHARSGMEPDPLINLPTPSSDNVPNLTRRGGVDLRTGTNTLQPGVYDYILISNNAEVTFEPGIYIIAATRENAMTITGGSKVFGDGVMFYNTGSNYLDNGAGYYDALDGDALPPAPDAANFGDVTINAEQVVLKGLNSPQSPFDGMLFYQRRRNTKGVDIQGNAGASFFLGGTLYAKWAKFKLAGQGKYDAQFVVGSLAVSGQADITINYAGKKLGKANQVFLVE